MNGKDLLLGLNNIDDTFIEEAGTMTFKKRRTPSWKQGLAVAACLGVIATAVFAMFPDMLKKPDVNPPKVIAPADVAKEESNKPEGSQISEKDEIHVNKLAEQSKDASKLRYDLEHFEFNTWSKKDIWVYYGKDLTPNYVPKGLLASEHNGKVRAIVEKPNTAFLEEEKPRKESQELEHTKENIPTYQGKKVVDDNISFSFYHAYNEDGMPEWTDGINANKGFTVTATKIGIVRDYLYISPDDKMEQSTIKGIPVTIGYRSMPYSPYDPDTHEPSGYYDLYVAEFEYDGIQYEIVTEQLPLDELVKIVRGVIS